MTDRDIVASVCFPFRSLSPGDEVVVQVWPPRPLQTHPSPCLSMALTARPDGVPDAGGGGGGHANSRQRV